MRVWSNGRHEVEIVDMILKLQLQLKLCDDEVNKSDGTISAAVKIPKATRTQLQRHLIDMQSLLPDDLQTILTCNRSS